MGGYRFDTTSPFEQDFKRLDPSIQHQVLTRLTWLATHSEQIGSPMKHLPTDLKGLHKYRVGDYRILFWVDHKIQVITLYGVEHRRSVYKRFR